MSYSLITALPLGSLQTGLTLSAQLYNTDGTTNGSPVTTGFVERPAGSGNYFWTYAGFPDGFRGGVAITAAGVFKMSFAINPQEAENADAKTSTRAATADSRLDNLDATVSTRAATADSRFANLDATVSSRAATADSRLGNLDAAVSTRVAASAAAWANLDAAMSSRVAAADPRLGNLDVAISSRAADLSFAGAVLAPSPSKSASFDLVPGDDYKNADGRQIPFTEVGTWPSLLGGSVQFIITGLIYATAIVTVASGAGKALYVELTTADTAKLSRRVRYEYDLVATLSNANRVTLVSGSVYAR